MKQLIITADDFGASLQINEAGRARASRRRAHRGKPHGERPRTRRRGRTRAR